MTATHDFDDAVLRLSNALCKNASQLSLRYAAEQHSPYPRDAAVPHRPILLGFFTLEARLHRLKLGEQVTLRSDVDRQEFGGRWRVYVRCVGGKGGGGQGG